VQAVLTVAATQSVGHRHGYLPHSLEKRQGRGTRAPRWSGDWARPRPQESRSTRSPKRVTVEARASRCGPLGYSFVELQIRNGCEPKQ
jgi:hypothetical protein